MFSDKRSKKVVFAVHCILNQNARIEGCGFFAGVINKPAQALIKSGAGIIQMPCPELLYAGLDRRGHECMKNGIRESMSTPQGQSACRRMARGIIRQIQEYQKNGFAVLGIIGNDGSPSCGVKLTWSHSKDKNIKGQGAFIAALRSELRKHTLKVPFIAIEDFKWEKSAERIKKLLSATV